MKKIRKPTFDVKDVLYSCIETFKSEIRMLKHQSAIRFILEDSCTFNEIMHNREQIAFPDTLQLSSCKEEDYPTSEEMIKLYSDKFVQNKTIRELYYDKLMISIPNGRCPFCQLYDVRNLDHFLPKSKYPLLSVTPANLIPICRDCNMDYKNDYSPEIYQDSLFHPYYDEINNDEWLFASVYIDELAEINIEFKVDPPKNWDTVLAKRITNSFSKYCLDARYTNRAIDEISNLKFKWKKLKEESSIQDVRNDIEQSLESFLEVSKNGWKQALYRNLKDNSDFLETYL